MTDDAETLGKGHFQVISGVSFFYDRSKLDDVTTIRNDGAEAAVISRRDLTITWTWS